MRPTLTAARCVTATGPGYYDQLGYSWDVHVFEDRRYEQGRRMELTCSKECREDAGYKERKDG